jgi:hypothetical protein
MSITTAPTNPPITTADFAWEKVTQNQRGVSVDSLIKLLTNSPRSVVEISLHDWTIVADSGKQMVQHANGAPMGFHTHKVPELGPHLFPVIVCEANGTTLVLDGNHRLACYLLNNCPSIKAVVVSEAEARSCINGSHSRFDEAMGLVPPAKP